MELAGPLRYRLRGSGSELSLDQRVAPSRQIYKIQVRRGPRLVLESLQGIAPLRKPQVEYIAVVSRVLPRDAVALLGRAHRLQQRHLRLFAHVVPVARAQPARTRQPDRLIDQRRVTSVEPGQLLRHCGAQVPADRKSTRLNSS